jgi:hypothetical protein
MMLLAACASTSPPTVRLALLAPFEGRYREIGYNALYAARLALAEAGASNVELLPIDDGGTPTIAADRAHALAGDPQVIGAVVLGYTAAASETLAAFGDLPVLVVGHWDAEPVSESVFILSSLEIPTQLTTPPIISITDAAQMDAPIVGGDVFALEQFPKLRPSLEGISVMTSGSLPNAEFVSRYNAGDPFAPEPGLLATLTYDAFRLLLAKTSAVTRPTLREALTVLEYTGLNGVIRFEAGWWVNAPIHQFDYSEEGSLVMREDDRR